MEFRCQTLKLIERNVNRMLFFVHSTFLVMFFFVFFFYLEKEKEMSSYKEKISYVALDMLVNLASDVVTDVSFIYQIVLFAYPMYVQNLCLIDSMFVNVTVVDQKRSAFSKVADFL